MHRSDESWPRLAIAVPALVLIALTCAGCGFHQRRHAQFDGAQATSVMGIMPRERYDAIRVRPRDLGRARGTDGSEFIVTLPDGSIMPLTEITPALCGGLALKVAGVSCTTVAVGADSAALDWNNLASGTSRITVPKPPRLAAANAVGVNAGAVEFILCGITYELSVRRPKSWGEPAETIEKRQLCHYQFWFEQGKCVQMEVSTANRHTKAAGFVPSIGVRTPQGERTFPLPVIESDLTMLFGARQSSLVTG